MRLLTMSTIRGKLILIILLVTMCTLGIGFLMVYYEELFTGKDEMINQYHLSAIIVGEYCVTPLAFDDRDGAEQVLEKLRNNPEIVYARIFDTEGNLFADYGKISRVQNLLKQIHQNTSAEFLDNFLYVSAPIYYLGEEYGRIELYISTLPLQKRMNKLMLFLVSLSLSLLLIAYFIAKRLQRKISDPILELAEVTHKIADTEDYHLRVERKNPDELGVLYHGFNQMVEQLERRKQERDKAVETLSWSEARYRQLFEDSPVGLWVEDFTEAIEYLRSRSQSLQIDYAEYFQKNPEEVFKCAQLVRVIDVNKAVLKMYAAENKQDLLGNLGKTFTGDCHTMFRDELITLAEGRYQFEAEAEVRTLQGLPMNIYMQLYVGLDENHQPDLRQVLVATNDITDRIRAEKTVRTSEARLRAFANALPDVAFILDEYGVYTEILTADESLLYQPAKKIKGLCLNEIFPEETATTFMEVVRRTIETGLSQTLEYWLKVPAGDRCFEARTAYLPDTIENRRMVMWVSRDITTRKQLEMQLQQAQKMEAIGRLAGGVAHDFNNILSVIIGYAEMGMGFTDENAPLKKPLQEIINASERAVSLTQQLLAFSRKQLLQPRVVDLNELVRNMQKMLKRLIGDDISLSTNLDGSVKPVKVDPGQFEQVLLNLAINARDAMPNGGTIHIESRTEKFNQVTPIGNTEITPGSYTQIIFSDDGVGMNKNILDRIFEPFFTTKEEGKGTGLGLSTVYGIVSQSKGYIHVYSEPGKGTCFKLYFPQAEDQVKKGIPASQKAADLHGGETVLVVEDEETLRDVTRIVLQQYGYKVLEAAHGEEAYQQFLNHRDQIDLVVTDVIMPGINGRQLVEQIREIRSGLKVLFMSGYTDDALIKHEILKKEVAFIHKPFSPTQLLQKIRDLLDQ